MKGLSYRLNKPTVGLESTGGTRICIIIPANAVVTVLNGPLNGNRMVDVDWQGHAIMIFAEDLRARGKIVKSVTAADL